MLRKLFQGLTVLTAVSAAVLVSCGDDDSPVDSHDPVPAAIEVLPSQLDFGSDISELLLFVTNGGDETLNWECDTPSVYVSLSHTSGSLTTGTDTIEVTVNREGIPLGTYYDTLIFTSNGGSDTVIGSVTHGLDPLPSLLGEYEGFLVYTTDCGQATAETVEYPILMRFSDQNYWVWDNSEAGDVICEPSGTYVLTAETVEFVEVVDGCSGTSGDPGQSPTGVFDLRLPSDSLVFSQTDSENNICKLIRLVPVAN